MQIYQVIEDVIAQYVDDEDNQNDDATSGIKWISVDGSSLKQFNFTEHNVGIKPHFYEQYINKDPYDIFKIFITDEIVEYMAEQTNLYAEQVLKSKPKSKGNEKSWVSTNTREMEKFLGIIMWMGLMKLPTLKSYWSKNCLYINKIKEIMPRNRFEYLLRMWHFNNNEAEGDENDRLRKITPLIEKLLDRFQNVLVPESDVCIDETIVPFRGRLKFRQYIKNKRHKFGIKLYKLCTNGGYTYNLRVYCGKDSEGEGNATSNVVMSLMSGLLDNERTLYTDNYYTSVSLANQLLQRKTHLVGTVRSNRKFNSKEVANKKLKKGEIFAQESNGIVMLKWKDTRDVLTLSTVHDDSTIVIQQRGKDVIKPKVIVDYNKSKAYIDLSDQLKAYSHCLRRGLKWYRKLAVEIIFGSAVVNSFLVYKEITQQIIQITEFRERLALALLHVDDTSTAIPPDISNSHTLQQGPNNRCVMCYADNKEKFGRIAAQNKTVRTKWRCSVCDKNYCITCFFLAHKSSKI